MTEQLAKQEKQFETQLTKVNNTYLPMINRQLEGNGVNMDDYSKQCVIAAISTINSVLDTKGIRWNDPQLDQSNVTQVLLDVAALKLNAAANPREVYFQIRNVKRGENNWVKQIEMGIEGDGNDAILARFGRGVESIKQHWLVREEDHFVYPTYNGLELSPPQWTPTGKGEVVRVVYPIQKKDGSVEYHIAERDDVVKNLIAHVNNNMMNETFGIAKDRFKATAEQKSQIDKKKQEILKKVRDLGLSALDDESIQQYISPAWRDPQSRESMIIRKMRNNIVKKIPKDFGSAFVEITYDQNADNEYKRVRKEINEYANQEVLDFDPAPHEQEQKQTAEVIDHEPVQETFQQEPPKQSTGTNGPNF
jgi:hypothetical protein